MIAKASRLKIKRLMFSIIHIPVQAKNLNFNSDSRAVQNEVVSVLEDRQLDMYAMSS